VWRQTHDVSLTLAGRAKALQRGAPVKELAASLQACVLCGACEPVCPVDIDTVGMTLQLRTLLMDSGGSAFAGAAELMKPLAVTQDTPAVSGASWFLPGRSLRADRTRVQRVTALFEKNGVARLAVDDGADLTIAIEAGFPLSAERKAQFLHPLQGARELIVGDGLLHRSLREWLPGVRVIGVGEALLRLAPVRGGLRPTDLYVIETRGYHAEFARLVRLYDRLRQEVGCAMNLDLLRAAIPTGAAGLQTLLGQNGLDLEAQTRWIVEGRKIERIVIEDPGDHAVFERIGTLPVVHLAELAGETV
jgi:ferredoxin